MDDGHLGYIKRFLKKNHLVRPGVHLLCYIAHTIYTIPRVTVVGQSEPTIVGQLLIWPVRKIDSNPNYPNNMGFRV
jgi:hypothetical protein